MSAATMTAFLNYFAAFEGCVAGQRPWQDLESFFTPTARYLVEGVPFACNVQGADNIVRAFERSVTNFDRKMDARGLEILSCDREGPHTIRVRLISSYTINGVGTALAPVSMHVDCESQKIALLKDLYDPQLTEAALLWIAKHAGDADPSYL